MGRQIAEQLVHVEQGAQAGRAALCVEPGHDLFQQQGDKELPLSFLQMSDVKDANLGFPAGPTSKLSTSRACQRSSQQRREQPSAR